MFRKLSTLALTGSLFLINCTTPVQAASLGVAPQANASTTQATRPLRPTLPQSPVTRDRPTPIPSYDAAAMIGTFAAEELGVTVGVTRAGGVDGDITLPPTFPTTVPISLPSEIEATIALAGQVSVGTISLYENRGAAEVAVGAGSISGDLEADITAASLGSYALLLPQSSLPADAATAQQLLVALYPALGAVTLEPIDAEQGYLFKAVTSSQSVDPKTMTVTTSAKVIIAGVNGQEQGSVAWSIVGNGDFALALADLLD